ncbi:MAG: hypothetical protein OES47_13315 [Acidobacteriota bacterium]|nr:hypothetical protein [Acidobacteriota bacterium]
MTSSRNFGGGFRGAGGIGGRSGGGGLGLSGPVPRDLWLLLGTVFATFSLQFFSGTRVVPELLRLSEAVWTKGFLWQIVTYPFIGAGQPGIWFVLELLILFLFGREIYYRLGRKNFWKLLIWVAAIAAVTAIVVELLYRAAGGGSTVAFSLLQGQRMLLTILVAAFATLYGQATILLFFVLPIQARWFLLLEVVFAFLGFLTTHDLAGFLGICSAVGATYLLLSPGPARGKLRQLWLRAQEKWFRLRLARAKQKRGLRVVRGEGEDDSAAGSKGQSAGRKPGDPWIH